MKNKSFVFSGVPRTWVLSNGSYSILLDDAGNGYSFVQGELTLTRWREDVVAGKSGSYVFVRDVESGALWSVAYQPTCVKPDTYEVLFDANTVTYVRSDAGILLHTEICVSPEDNIELRRVRVTNNSKQKRNLEITSFAEVALAHARGDASHPAFAKMFVETEHLADFDALVCARRPRSKHEEKWFLLHMLAEHDCSEARVESSRAKFLGRGNTAKSPQALLNGGGLSGSTGAVLDPVVSLQVSMELKQGEVKEV